MQQIVLLVLLIECFWGLKIADYNVVALVFSIPFIYYYIEYRQRKKFFSNKADSFITFVWIFILINIISCWTFRNQSPWLTIRTSDVRNFVPLFFFYFLLKKKYSVIDIEKSIEVLLFSYVICYMLQYFVFYPDEIFHLISNSEGEKRFRFVGQLINFIGYFYFLNKVLLEKSAAHKNILGLILSFICIVLLGFRSSLASLLFVSIIQIYRVNRFSVKSVKTVFVGMVCLFIFSQTEVAQNVIGNMTLRQQSQTFSNEDYIRWQEFNYYTNDHFQNGYEMFWGSGPWNEDSQYGKYMKYIRMDESMISGNSASVTTWWDWGLVGLSWAMGIPLAVLLYIFLFYMAFKKTDKSYLYISSVYIFLIITSVTTIESYRFGAFTFHAMMIYLIYTIHQEKIKRTMLIK